MELTIKVNPTERTVRFREVHALAAGDAYSSVTLAGVTGAQTAALQLKLFKDSSASTVLAQCSSFAEVPGHPSERRGAVTLATQALKDWYESVANDATATDTNGMPSALVNAWLVISDSVKTWAACQVPLILRAMDTNVVQGADGISPVVSLSKSGSVLTISITDVNGTHTETVSDGQDGPPGVSPTVVVDVNPATGNVRVTAVNADGSVTTREVDVSGKAEKSEMSVTDGSDATKKTIQLKSGLSQEVLVAHQDVTGKANKSEMSVTEGADATKRTVQLKSGLSQEVVVEHQDVSGKMDGAAAYPAWAQATIYGTVGTVVSHAGRLWRNLEPVTDLEPGASGVAAWEEVFLKDLKQDALSQPQTAALAKAGKAVLTLSIVAPEGRSIDGQAVVVGDRTFYQSTWANRPPVVLAGVERAEIRYGDYASDCSVRLNGADVGRPESVVLEADSLLEVHFADCLHPDTPILMADGTRKRVADVRAGDRVATPFGPDEVTRTSAGRGARMDEWLFSDGTAVRTVGRHRFWNADLGEFMYLEAWNVGERAVRADGTVAELVSRRTSEGDFPHATLFTARWNVYYAGGLVAGNRKSARPWR